MRYYQLTLAGLTTAALFLGCEDSATSRQARTLGVTDPAMTVAVGFTSTPVTRVNAGTFHVSSNANGFNVQLSAEDNADVALANVVISPGGKSGWHSHPGPVLVVVTSGTVTFYRVVGQGNAENAIGGRCSRTDYPAGSSFVEVGGHVVQAQNEGSTPATVSATFFVPAGSPTRIDQPAPGGNCPA